MPTNIPSLQPSVRTDHTIVLPVHIGKTVHVGTPVHIGTVSHHHAIILPVKMRAGTVSHQMSFNYYYIFHLYRFAYYAEYKKVVEQGMPAVQAKAAATAAAEAAVKSARLPYNVNGPKASLPTEKQMGDLSQQPLPTEKEMSDLAKQLKDEMHTPNAE